MKRDRAAFMAMLRGAAPLVVGVAVFTTACQGTVGDASNQVGGSDIAICSGARDVGHTYLRRLTHAEYANTIEDLLGIDVSEDVEGFPSDRIGVAFETAASTQTIPVPLGERYMTSAYKTAQQAMEGTNRNEVLGCDPTAGNADTCLRTFAQQFGRRAYRRPLTDGEVDRLLELGEDESSAYDRAALIIGAMLQSPKFLYRVEVGTPDPDDESRVRLSGYEVATRLAFALWSAAPDDALLDAAEAGQLDSADGIEAVAREMIAQPRTREALMRFAEQWFQLDTLESLYRDPAIHPMFDDDLRDAMRQEARLLLDESMWTESTSFLDLYTVRHGYANDALAALYGIEAPGSDELVRVDFGASRDRGGWFTTAALLTATAHKQSPSPVARGKFIRDAILCDPIPPPPQGVTPPNPMEGESLEEAFDRHTDDPYCSSCHRHIDPIGHGLDRYDSIGKLRTTYDSGEPVRTSGHIEGIADSEFSGGVDLGELMHADPEASACVVRHTFRWIFGRLEGERGSNEDCIVSDLETEFRDDGQSFIELLVTMVRSDSFRYRRRADSD